jgi:magnesium transporter
MRFAEELLRLPVFDVSGDKIGHLHDLAITKGENYPHILAVAVLVYETSKIGIYQLPESVYDIPLPISWEQISEITPEGIWLKKSFNELPLFESEGEEIFLSRDLLDNQIVDTDGHRVQRVDDLILQLRDNQLTLLGIYIGFGSRLKILDSEKTACSLAERFGEEVTEDLLPWVCVANYGKELEEITLNVGTKK